MNMNIDCEEFSGNVDVGVSLEALEADGGVSIVDELEGVSSTNESKAAESSLLPLTPPPRVGMVFERWEGVDEYYKRFGMDQGFCVSRVSGAYRTGKESGKVRRSATWRCECYGVPDTKARREAKRRAKGIEIGGSMEGHDQGIRKRKSKKCECPAMVYASLNAEDGWELKKVVLEHNHKLTLTKSKLVKEGMMKGVGETRNRRLSNDFNDGSCVPQIHGSSTVKREVVEDMPMMEKCCPRVLEHERRLRMEGGDANSMMDLFEIMQRNNQNLFHAHRFDEFGVLQDVLWVDARSKAAYKEFGDVVCFDTTYLTNEYELPLFNFVGVNHHGQLVLLGCGLVSHDDVDTYAWIFRQWLVCMGGKAPDAILTNEDEAMRKVITEVIPDTCHKWCIRQILQKLLKKMCMYARYQELEDELKEVVYESFTVDEFQSRWVRVVDKYELGDNDWLQRLYEERAMWVPAFVKDIFLAGMQRVGSMNNFFDNFVTRHTKLFEFAEKYCAAMEDKVSSEKNEDTKSMKYVRKLVTGFKAEEVFQKVYTNNKFREVQRECERVIYCYGKGEVVGDTVVHLMEDRVWIVFKGSSEEVITDRRRLYRVCYNVKSREVECDCKLFETHGILCRHCIRVLDHHLFGEVPDKYILKQWRKDVSRKHARVKVAYHDPSNLVEVKRYDSMMAVFEPLCDISSNAEETMAVVMNGLKDIQISLNEWLGKRSVSSMGDTDVKDMHTVIDGIVESNGQSQMTPSNPTQGTKASVVVGRDG
ncbi:protein FAR1-RELATED SEQUENCE 8-like [Chenopodium quinoa]|uniref:protein FAR1-RELATED SEQUENCE 8-like n=1 Tax=Chenopodium quinoa TaxID=63459 RepID=UPI000B781C17|nr:protein FAR1-RELATED SEQUENCE 8-like [Chenopodium quinoa]